MQPQDEAKGAQADEAASDDRSFLSQAHLIAAGVRVFVHREGKPPSVEELAEFLHTTPELVYHMVNRLEHEEVLRTVRTSFETKVYLRRPENLRDLPEQTIPELEDEMRKHRERKREEQEKLGATLSASAVKRRQQERLADLERKMKEGLGKKKPPWAE
ncbi:MAG: hypothetical protein MUE60_08760 [Candidatus Eisenbacteria bacterium]|jgi:ethanolamine ammonia-lyase small subunit|nr:hypothetical protein [Candidatus Eisenbacteria bacterium]